MKNEVKKRDKYKNMTEKKQLNFSDFIFKTNHVTAFTDESSCNDDFFLIIVRIMFTVWMFCGISYTLCICIKINRFK